MSIEKVAEGLYCLKSVSSVELRVKAVGEMRAHHSIKFKIIVIKCLSKELKMDEHLMRRAFTRIPYRGNNNITKKHKLYLTSDDGIPRTTFGGIRDFCCQPPVGRVKAQSQTVKNGENESKNFIFVGEHFPTLCKILAAAENASKPRIFLQSSKPEMLDSLRKRLLLRRPLHIDRDPYGVYDYANILKLHLQQMDEPIFKPNYYAAYARISLLEQTYQDRQYKSLKDKSKYMTLGGISPPDPSLKREEKKIVDCIQLVVHLLNAQQRETLRYIMDILVAVHSNASHNRMLASTVAAIFAPLLLCPRGLPRDVKIGAARDMNYVVMRMIRMGPQIFDSPTILLSRVWDGTRHFRKQMDFTQNEGINTYV